jgi:membrane-bound serine protease (ClpP class)
VDVLTVKGVIDSWVDGYIRRGIGVAERDGAEAIIIVLDTPGGTLTAMQDTTARMLNARVPVVVFVAPAGAWAASAGTFITMAANVAAMAPGTTIGAAHPVSETGQTMQPDELTKVTNFSISMIQSIAQQRGRNADWATQAVRDSIAATAQEALDQHVIDLIATDLNDLLNQMDGRTVQTAAGQVTLHTQRAGVLNLNMNVPESVFHTLVDPNIALVLLLLGLIAIAVELYHPGISVAGIVGGICLVLAFVSLGNLPVNWGGAILVIISVILFIVDVKVNSLVLTIGGLVMFILGALLLFAPLTAPSPVMPRVSVSPVVVGILGVSMALFFVFLLGAAVRGRRFPVLSGHQALLGATGTAVSDLAPAGQVQVKSELWTAIAVEGPIQKGDGVEVVGIEGLRLKVRGQGHAELKP